MSVNVWAIALDVALWPLLILGAGFMRGNLIAQVGSLYPAGDPRSANGIQIYYAMVNIGGFIALYGVAETVALIDDALAGRDPRVKVALYVASADADPFSEAAIRAARSELSPRERRCAVFSSRRASRIAR